MDNTNEIFIKTNKLGFAEEQTIEDITKEVANQFKENVEKSLLQVKKKDVEKEKINQERKLLEEQVQEVQKSDLTEPQKKWLILYLNMDYRRKKLVVSALEMPRDKELLPWIIKFSKNADSHRSFANYARKMLEKYK